LCPLPNRENPPPQQERIQAEVFGHQNARRTSMKLRYDFLGICHSPSAHCMLKAGIYWFEKSSIPFIAIKLFEIDLDNKRYAKQGFEAFAFGLPAMVFNDLRYNEVPEHIISQINNQLDNSLDIKNTTENLLEKETKIIIFALLAIFWGTSSIQAQEVNMSRYITLTVKQGTTVHFDIWADAPNTPIKVISGDKEREITAGTEWTSIKNYIAGAGTMTIYGNVWQFNCHDNASNITGLDASNNAKLQTLICNNNAIATMADIRLTKISLYPTDIMVVINIINKILVRGSKKKPFGLFGLYTSYSSIK